MRGVGGAVGARFGGRHARPRRARAPPVPRFDPVVSALPQLAPDGFIYLRATPGTCQKRMRRRGRGEEMGASGDGLPLDYLEGLHAKHDAWLASPGQLASRVLRGGRGVGGIGSAPGPPGGILTTSTLLPRGAPAGLLDLGTRVSAHRPDPAAGVPEPSEIAGQVYYLDSARQAGLHAACDGAPALVLDCDSDIDLSADTEAKAHYGRQVRAYFEYVKRVRETRAAADGAGGPGGSRADRGSRAIRATPADVERMLAAMGGRGGR